MQIALAVGTMLLGGWVLNAPEEEEEMEPMQPPAMAPGPSSPSMPNMPLAPRPSRTERGQGRATRGAAGQRTRTTPTDQSGQSVRSPMTGGMPTQWPSSPTGAMAPGGIIGQPTAPTASGPQGPVPVVGPGSFGPREPTAPTAQLAMPSQARPDGMSRALVDMNRTRTQGTTGPTIAPPAPEKAFATFRPSSGVSPYMNLFRVQGDTLDNYTSLVRPQVEQRFLNQQYGRDIHTLETNTRTQGVNLQQLYRSNQTLQGVATPQYYMNTGSYFPQQQGQ